MVLSLKTKVFVVTALGEGRIIDQEVTTSEQEALLIQEDLERKHDMIPFCDEIEVVSRVRELEIHVGK